MKRIAYLSTFALLGLAVMLAPTSAEAICGSGISFSQSGYVCNGGTTYCYVTSPGQNTLASTQRSFWHVGFADGATGIGNDNGSYQAWMIDFGFGGGLTITGDWGGNGGIDGCPDNDEGADVQRMGAAFTDTSADGSQSFFAVACRLRDVTRGAQWDFNMNSAEGAADGVDINLVPIPQARIASSVRNVDGSVTVSVAPPDFSAGFYTFGSECTLADAVPEFEVWFQEVPSNDPAPTDRRTGWNLGNTCSIGGNCDVTLPQGTTDAYFAVTPGFGGGLNTGDAAPDLGPNSVRVATDPNMANPVDIKVIRKGDVDKLKQRRR